MFVEAIINGILLGGIYAAAAIGFSLAFGVMDIINIAQGELIMLGGFAAYWLFKFLGLDPFFTVPIVFFILFGFGSILQKGVVNPAVEKKAELVTLVLFFGISITLQHGALLAWGANYRIVTSSLSGSNFVLGGYVIPTTRFLTFLFATASAIGLFLFLKKTRIGLAIQATAQDRDAATAVGINVKKIYVVTLGLCFGITGVGGALLSSIAAIYANMGSMYTLFAFFIVILGGLGYIPGTFLGAFLLGLLQSLVISYLGARYTYLIIFAVLYVLILFFPRGILGKGKL